ncbi:small acid-soluble spore protein H (minor) [Evansella caseinilytica]|uniref:Small, acid-soluble spore protein H n=1 Tax=Evansella caseinilytica TaxID=1503961 RepID=A0A1H3RDU1_9BACI|nr:H-type small acid-soluble spore protein [Evansella caseinilytica]SDZ23495.1 small acid-soluble spore protein H (minor) [Evansella caseinilytica]
MDSRRAQEIVNSPTLINVRYNGVPVYIQEVVEEKGMARVFPLDEMNHEQEVDLAGLQEG